MAEKTIKVVIDGQEFVSTAAGKAERSVESFSSKVKNLLAPLAALGIGAALGGFFKKAIEESLEGEQSMQRMQTAVENAGQAFAQMRPKIDSTIGDLTRLTVYTDDQLMAAFSDMTVQTGDARGALGNLGLAADLAAAKSIPLETASAAIGKAMAGNTTALQKMIPELKGSTDLIGDLRIKVEGTAEKMGGTFAGSVERAKNQFSEFAQAVGDAILGADSMQGSGNILVDTLASMATWVQDNSEEIGLLVDVLKLAGVAIWEALAPAITMLGRIAKPILGGFVALVAEMSFALRSWAVFSQDTFGKVVTNIANFGQSVAGLLKRVGIDLNTEGLDRMKSYGEAQTKEADGRWTSLTGEHKAFWDKFTDTAKTGEANTVKALQTGSTDSIAEIKKRAGEVDAEAKKMKEALEKNLGPPVATMIGLTEGAIKKLGAAAKEQLPPETAQKFNEHMESLAANAELVRQRLTDSTPAVNEARDSTSDMAQQTASIARAGLEAAQAFGVMSDGAAKTLSSVITLGESIALVAGGDPSAIPAMIASAANLISQMVSDGGRKKLIADNTREMERLRLELGNLSLNVSGDDFAKIRSALGEVIPQLRGGRGAANTTDIVNALARRGLGMGDLKKLADQLGIRIFSDSGALSVDGIKQLFESMGLVELGQFGQDYASQKQSTESGFGVNKTSDLGQIGELGALGGRFSSALAGVVDVTNLADTRDRLKGLFERMQTGGLSAEDLGGLTGSEFLAFVTDLISRIDTLAPSTGSGSGSSGGTGGTGSSGSGSTGSGSSSVVPTKSLADVLDGVAAQTTALGVYHTKHLSLATDHLAEAKMQTGILTEIATNTRSLIDGGLEDMIDEKLSAKQSLAALSGGVGPSF
jgi:hypothetical protein